MPTMARRGRNTAEVKGNNGRTESPAGARGAPDAGGRADHSDAPPAAPHEQSLVPQPPLLFEVAWEVCWQLGGIYTVLRTKAATMLERWGDRYCLIGPYNPATAAVEFEEQPTYGSIRETLQKLKESGITCYFGRWLIAGRPRVILISHFYNERMLLPYWIQHHAPLFDAAVLLDYNSTDDSVEIIRREAPSTWRVVPSRNAMFGAEQLDAEVVYWERQFGGAWKIALTTTEFLVHSDLHELVARLDRDRQTVVRFHGLNIVGNDSLPLQRFVPLLQQRSQYGLWADAPQYGRFLHRLDGAPYSTGRHALGGGIAAPTEPSGFIAKFFFSPWPQSLQRKTQIKARIPVEDTRRGFGVQHMRDEAAIVKARDETMRIAQLWDLRDVIRAPTWCAPYHRLWEQRYSDANYT